MSMLSRFATLGGAPTDPYWNNVSLLLVGNGANGTTTNIKDSSKNNVAISIVGNTVISTAQSKYGSGSIYFDGTGDRLLPTASSLFSFGTGDFTVECWLYRISGNGVFSNGPTAVGSFGLGFGAANGDTTKLQAAYYGGGAVSCTTSTPSNQWVYYAISRNGNNTRIFYNGALEGTLTGSPFDNTSNTPSVGEIWVGYITSTINAYVYDLRVTKGVGRYTASFTPPTAPLPTTGP